MIDPHHGWNVSFKPLYLGFTSAIVFLAAAYRTTVHYHLTGTTLAWTILGIAGLSALLQLFFFLHVGMGSKPRWHLISFLFTALIILIVVVGTVWIMNNLDYNMMLPGGQ
jgi:cytochrome o ubiquinol oxidase operon protein cyoD